MTRNYVGPYMVFWCFFLSHDVCFHWNKYIKCRFYTVAMGSKNGLERTELSMFFDLSTIGGPGIAYLDLAQCLSVVNRRTYEQSRCYHISKILLLADDVSQTAGAFQAAFSTAPNTWVTANAWVKAEAAWRRSRAEVLKDNPSIEGKWDSFKAFLTTTHAAAGVGANLLPVSTKAGEWNMSSLVLPDVTPSAPITLDQFNMHLLGDNAGDPTDGTLTSAGIIQGYSETRALVSEKDVPADAGDSWLVRLFDMGEQESQLSDIIVDEGDLPPYDRDDLPGTGSNQEAAGLAVTVGGIGDVNYVNLSTYIPGFYVPGGLLQVKMDGLYDDDKLKASCVIFMSPGGYKGVHAPHIRQ